jgi:hypothetical protein
MAYHKWDVEYYKKELKETMESLLKRQLQIADLQKQLSLMKGRQDFIKPILFLEQGCMLEPLLQIELTFQFRVVWLKKGATPPIIYEPQKTA